MEIRIRATRPSDEWSDWRNGTFWWIQSVYVRQDARQRGVLTPFTSTSKTWRDRAAMCAGLRLYVERGNGCCIPRIALQRLVKRGVVERRGCCLRARKPS